MDEEKVNTDTLFLALTRPPLKWGVPYDGFRLNIIGTFVAGMFLGSPLYWFVGILVHLPMRWITSRDHNAFRVRRLWLETKGNAVGSDLWGGASLAPLPVWSTKKPTEVRGSV